MASTTEARSRTRPLTIVSMMVLIGIEVFGVAIAGGWALAGLLELGDLFGYVLMGAFSVLGAYLMLQLWRRAQTQTVISRRR